MLTEEALIVFAALGALGLLALGTLELLWPSQPKRRVRREAIPAPAPAPEPRRWRSSHPRHAANAPQRYLKRETATAVPSPAQSTPAAEPALVAAADPALVAAEAPATEEVVTGPTAAEQVLTRPPATEQVLTGPLVDHCFALYQERRYPEVVELASGALGVAASPARRPADAAEAGALGSMLALAQQALGDHAAARTSLEQAIAIAPETDRATYRRQLTTLTLSVAQDLLASAAALSAPDSDNRVRDLREALTWLEPLDAVDPDDADVRELASKAEMRLWPAYERLVTALVQRQQFREARRWLREALEDARLPETRRETFRELWSATFSGEIGQLTAHAIRSMQEAHESDALTALERAERLLETVHEDALSPERREEVDRRLWWGYNNLGLRRVAAGAFEEAIDPLVHALRLAGTAPDRQLDTRTALIEAFESWTEACALAIREVAEGGDRDAAIVQRDRLWTRLRDAGAAGLSEQELAGALARARGLVEEFAQES